MKGTIQIGRIQSNLEGDYIQIRLQDDESGVPFAVIKMPLAAFASAITGLYEHMDWEPLGLELIGTKREHKTENVTRSQDYPWSQYHVIGKSMAAADIAPLEVDGWRGSVDDMFNNHQLVNGSKNTYRVHFTRHVRPDGTPVL